MRKKLVITRVGRQAPQSSQVWPEELPVPLAERAAQLYPLIASGTGTREEYLELAASWPSRCSTGSPPAALSAWLTGASVRRGVLLPARPPVSGHDAVRAGRGGS